MSARFSYAYVLVQDRPARFAAMAYLSASALLRVDPQARIHLICDAPTAAHLNREDRRLLDLMHQTIVADVPAVNPRARSFHLKTRVRDFVEGDYLYLDTDTLPVRPFFEVFADPNWEIALVQDRNHHFPVRPGYPFWLHTQIESLGWKSDPHRYFNAGLGFYRDTPAVRALVADWQQRWWKNLAIGDEDDQLPLNCALHDSSVRLRELPPAYNAMVLVSPVHARRARIYHFFAGNRGSLGLSLMEHLLRYLESTGRIDWETFDRCVAMDHPWTPPYWAKELWQTGNRWRAVKEFARNRLRRLWNGQHVPKAGEETARP